VRCISGSATGGVSGLTWLSVLIQLEESADPHGVVGQLRHLLHAESLNDPAT